jgi:hypothetical protein
VASSRVRSNPEDYPSRLSNILLGPVMKLHDDPPQDF